MPIQFIACGNVPGTTRISLLQFFGIYARWNSLKRKASPIAEPSMGIKCRLRVDFPPERDQQKWDPVLRPIALSDIKRAHDLVAKPLTLWRIMR